MILEYEKKWKGETDQEALALAAAASSAPAEGGLASENSDEASGLVSVVHGTPVASLLKIHEGADNTDDVIIIPMIESVTTSGETGVFVADRYALSLNSYSPSSQGIKVCLVFWVHKDGPRKRMGSGAMNKQWLIKKEVLLPPGVLFYNYNRSVDVALTSASHRVQEFSRATGSRATVARTTFVNEGAK